ncbi:MAG TPA: protein-methionine-sulfoxide reductase heme-binding subunit MsrQ [Polyangiaceae bacterium]|nr:protein-methionine-sulfoxide reductase heme-binding subunit MsrQ [Polyangiaceae bacterium]
MPRRLLKPGVFVACLLPLVKLGVDAARDHLSPNPIAESMNRLGFWTLTLLLASLAATPLKTFFGWTAQMRVRKMVGLFAFFYAALHFTTYLALDQAFDFSDIGADIVKRKFITIGFAAFVTLVPLAVTSTDAAVKRLGFRRWKRIHRLVYVAAVLGVVHFVWRVKADYLEPALFALTLTVLLFARFVPARGKKASPAETGKPKNAGQESLSRT